jgi:predicted nucleic acid-binding protein
VDVALQAVAYHNALGGDPVDCMVAARARWLNAPVVTGDQRITGLAGIPAIW